MGRDRPPPEGGRQEADSPAQAQARAEDKAEGGETVMTGQPGRAVFWALMGASGAALVIFGGIVGVGLVMEQVLERREQDDWWPGEATDYSSKSDG